MRVLRSPSRDLAWKSPVAGGGSFRPSPRPPRSPPPVVTLAVAVSWCPLGAQEPDTWDPAVYELRIMTAKPRKLEALHDWFQAHREDVLAKNGAE